jgi:SAM-dependent methyltransferase
MTRTDHYAHCTACDYWSSDLEHDVASTAAPDSEYDLVSYEHTRRANYLAILKLLAARHPPGARLLELGCADGLFLELAREHNGFEVLGIEPNTKMMAGNKHGHEIRRGFFPEVLAGSATRFDVIALNCVFEHVPDVAVMLEAFKAYLVPGGSVMLNVPVSSGFMFRAAHALFRLGVRYPFDRLWQQGFVSPHLHYFAAGNLARLLDRHGFALVAETPLSLFSLGGIYQRLSLDPNIRFVQRWTALGGLYAYYPLQKLAPDARAFVFTADRAE